MNATNMGSRAQYAAKALEEPTLKKGHWQCMDDNIDLARKPFEPTIRELMAIRALIVTDKMWLSQTKCFDPLIFSASGRAIVAE